MIDKFQIVGLYQRFLNMARQNELNHQSLNDLVAPFKDEIKKLVKEDREANGEY